MKITIDLSDDHFTALAAGLPASEATDEERVAAYLSTQVASGIAPQFVKIADDKRFAAVGLPNLKYHGLDDEQADLLIANAAPKHAARLAAKAAEEAAKALLAPAEEPK